MAVAKGPEIHGEASSADASGFNESQARLALYPGGSKSALTLSANDVLYVTSLVIAVGATLTITIYDGTDATADAGEIIATVVLLANTSICIDLSQSPHRCIKGTYAHLKASGSGQVYVNLKGTIFNQP